MAGFLGDLLSTFSDITAMGGSPAGAIIQRRKMAQALQQQGMSSIAPLVQAGIPVEQAGNLINQREDNQRSLQQQQLMQQFLGGGGGIPTSGAGGNYMPMAALGIIEPYQALSLQMQQQAQQNQEAQRQAENTRAQEQKAYDREKELKALQVPGLELIEGNLPDSATVRDARAATGSKKKLNASLDRLEKSIITYGFSPIPGTKGNTEQTQLIADIRNAERMLANTGVLNTGEVPFLEQSYDSFNPTKWKGAAYSTQELLGNLQEYRANRNADFSTNLEALGYKVADEKLAPVQQNAAPQAQENPNADALVSEAQDAINKGAPVDAVINQLLELGIPDAAIQQMNLQGGNNGSF